MTVFAAIQENDSERVRQLVEDDPALAKRRDEQGVSALLLAKYYGRDEIAELLAATDPELDVFEAAAYGRTDRLRGLLDQDPALANAWAPDGFQPLGLACFFGQPDAARLLLERGADVNSRARHAQIKTTPLQAAVAGGDPEVRYEIAKLLLEQGADPAAEQEGGETPLSAAEQHGDGRLVALLRQYLGG